MRAVSRAGAGMYTEEASSSSMLVLDNLREFNCDSFNPTAFTFLVRRSQVS